MLMIESLKKLMNNFLKRIQEKTEKRAQALRETQENTSKQMKKLNKTKQDIKTEMEKSKINIKRDKLGDRKPRKEVMGHRHKHHQQNKRDGRENLRGRR